MPSPLMRIRSPCLRCVVIAATKSASRLWACFFGRACASPSCSNTAFTVTTGAATALALGVGAADFDLGATAAAFFAADFLAEAFFAGAGGWPWVRLALIERVEGITVYRLVARLFRRPFSIERDHQPSSQTPMPRTTRPEEVHGAKSCSIHGRDPRLVQRIFPPRSWYLSAWSPKIPTAFCAGCMMPIPRRCSATGEESQIAVGQGRSVVHGGSLPATIGFPAEFIIAPVDP